MTGRPHALESIVATLRARLRTRRFAVGICAVALAVLVSTLGVGALMSAPGHATIVGGDGAPFPEGAELVVRRWALDSATGAAVGSAQVTRAPWDGRTPRTVAVPRDRRTEAYLSHVSYGTRPAAVLLRPGGEAIVHLLPHRSVRLLHAPARRPRRNVVHLLPDRSVPPAGGNDVVDALTGWLDGGAAWVLRTDGGASSVDRLPLHPCHLFVAVGGERAYHYLPADETCVDLRDAGPSFAVRVAPTWDGRPLPAGVFVAPGRLDLRAVLELGTGFRAIRGFLQPVPGGGEAWTPIDVPRAAWLTFFHPHLGLAHVRADAPQPWHLEPGPGAVIVQLPRGARFTGKASLLTKWRGGGTRDVAYVAGERAVRLSLPGPLRFSGLPLGTYAVWLEGRIEREDRETAVRTRRVLTLTRDAPRGTFVLDAEE